MGKKAGLSSANSQEQVKARVSRVKQAPAHDWLARVAMKFEVLAGLYPDSRKAGSNNFDLTPFPEKMKLKDERDSCWNGGARQTGQSSQSFDRNSVNSSKRYLFKTSSS